MTMPFSIEESANEQDGGEYWEPEPIPVKITHGEGIRVAPEYASWTNFTIPVLGQGTPAQLCPHRYHRYKAKFIVQGNGILYLNNRREPLMAANSATTSFITPIVPPIVTGTIANAPVTAAFAAAGNGTATLVAGNSLSAFAVNFGAVTTANTVPVTVTGAVGGTQTYDVALAVNTNPTTFVQNFPVPLIPASPGTPIAVTVTGNVNSPAGTIVAYPTVTSIPTQGVVILPDYDSQQPLYAVASQAGIIISVLDESYGLVQ